MSGGTPPKPKTPPVRPPRPDGWLGSSLSPGQRPEEEIVEEAASLTPITYISLQRQTPGLPDNGNGRAARETEADVSNKSSRKADGTTTEKRPSSLKKKVSFILSPFSPRLPQRAPPVPQFTRGSRIFQGGFRVIPAPRTPTSTENPSGLAEPAVSPTTPVLRSGRGVFGELSPLAINNSGTLNQVLPRPGILRNQRPPPINPIGNVWTPPPVPRLLPYSEDNDQAGLGSPGPSNWRARLRRERGERSPLSRTVSNAYDEPLPEQPEILSAAHSISDTTKEELKTGKTKGFKDLLKSSKTPEKSNPSSPEELNSNSQQDQAIVFSVLTNIVSNRPQHAEELSPVSPTMKSPLFSGNSFRNLYKKSPRTPENPSSPLSRPQYNPERGSRNIAVMNNNQENEETGVSAIMNDKDAQAIVEEDESQASTSSSSSSNLIPLDPLPETQVVQLPRVQDASWMQFGSLPHPVAGNSRFSQNAMNYTDREYGMYYLGYTWLQPGVPSGLDSLLSIGNYGRKLRIFALNASNERFKKPGYYKPFEVEQWAWQQGELLWRNSDDLPAKTFHDENFEKINGFGEPLCKTVRSLPDLRSAWELSKPFDAAASYSLPPRSYPLRKFVCPEKALSFEPHKKYTGLSKESNAVDTFPKGHARIGSRTSHIEAIDPFELNVDLNFVMDKQQEDGAGEKVGGESGGESGGCKKSEGKGKKVAGRSIARKHVSPFSTQRLNTQDTILSRPFASHDENSDSNHLLQAAKDRYPLLEITNDYLTSDIRSAASLQETIPFNEYYNVQGEADRAQQNQERDIVQRLNDIDWMFEDSQEENENNDQEEQQELGTAHTILNQDIVQRLNDIDWMFEDSDQEDVNSNSQKHQNPENQVAINTAMSADMTATSSGPCDNFKLRKRCDSQTKLIPLFLAPNAHLPQMSQSTEISLPFTAGSPEESSPIASEGNLDIQHQHTSQNVPISTSTRVDDNSISYSTDKQEDLVTVGLRGGGFKDSRIKTMISVASSKFKRLASVLKSKHDKDMSVSKKGKAPVWNAAVNDEASIEYQVSELSGIYTTNKVSTTTHESNTSEDSQEISLSPEFSHYRSPDAIILSNGSIIPTSSDGYAVARFGGEAFIQAPRINSSHGDIRRIVPLDLNKSLPALPKIEKPAKGSVLNSRAWVEKAEKAEKASTELEKYRVSESPTLDQSSLEAIEKATSDAAVIATKLASLEKRISMLEGSGGSCLNLDEKAK